MYAHKLAQWGYDIAIASDGEEALRRICEDNIQLVIADWQMPKLDGLSLCREVRARQLPNYTYIIMVSAEKAEEYLIASLDAGADDFLSKPVDTSELEARLESAVRRLNLQASLQEQSDELAQTHEDIERDLLAVSEVQVGSLPPSPYVWKSIVADRLFLPSVYVSGDHINIYPLSDTHIGFYILDVSGHGIPAAIRSMGLARYLSPTSSDSVLYKTAADTGERTPRSPSEVVKRLNQRFQQTDSDFSYFTLIYGYIEESTGRGVFCQAGHGNPLLVKPGGQVKEMGGGGYPVGLFTDVDFEDVPFVLNTGDTLYLYSDGLTEADDGHGDLFGLERFADILSNTCSRPIHDTLRASERAVRQWRSVNTQVSGFEDDISVLAIRRELLTAVSDVLGPNASDEHLSVDNAMSDLPLRLMLKNTAEPAVRRTDNLNILLVDDSASHLRLFGVILRNWGFVVNTATNASTALEYVETTRPDIVLTDWDMPVMSGVDLCEAIRKVSLGKYIYIIMVTGMATRDDLLQSLRVGADDFLTKPVNPNELRIRLGNGSRVIDLHNKLEATHNRLLALYQELDRDLQAVGGMQRDLLPAPVMLPERLSMDWRFKPMRYVSAQHLNVVELDQNTVGFFLMRVPGRGIPAALLAMTASRWLTASRGVDVLFRPPSNPNRGRWTLMAPAMIRETLQQRQDASIKQLDQSSLLFGLIDARDGKLAICQVGSGQVMIEVPGMDDAAALQPMSLTPSTWAQDSFAQATAYEQLSAGCRLIAYQATTEEGNEWSLPGDDLATSYASSLQDRLNSIEEQACTPQQTHDICLLGLQWKTTDPIVTQHLNAAQMAAFKDEMLAYLPEPLPRDVGQPLRGLRVEHSLDLRNVQPISQQVGEFGGQAGMDEVAAYFLDLAVVEACTNIVRHGLPADSLIKSVIDAVQFEHALVVTIQDKGRHVEGQHFVDAMTRLKDWGADDIQDVPEGGLGLALIQNATDHWHYGVNGDNNVLVLIKWLDEVDQ